MTALATGQKFVQVPIPVTAHDSLCNSICEMTLDRHAIAMPRQDACSLEVTRRLLAAQGNASNASVKRRKKEEGRVGGGEEGLEVGRIAAYGAAA